MWDLIVLVPDNCLSFYLVLNSVRRQPGSCVPFIGSVTFVLGTLGGKIRSTLYKMYDNIKTADDA